MIRFIKWTYKDFELSELMPSTFYIGAGNYAFIFSKFKGGASFSLASYNNMYELQVISKKKRPDLVDFSGFNNIKYFEVG